VVFAGAADAPALPSHLQRTLATLTTAPGPLTVEAVRAVEGGSATAPNARLKDLAGRALIERVGAGVRSDPYRWRPVAAAAGAVRDDPRYVAYLKSPEWAARRDAALAHAGGTCERCGAPAREVHHLTYERVGAELPDDLIARCPGGHRRAHGEAPASRNAGAGRRGKGGG
jgi:hypothetical protein